MKPSHQKSEKTSGKKSKVPVQLDIGNMLAVLEKKQQTQKDKQDTKGVILSGYITAEKKTSVIFICHLFFVFFLMELLNEKFLKNSTDTMRTHCYPHFASCYSNISSTLVTM